MAVRSTPKFQNDQGRPVIHIGVKEFECIGARPPHDHPHIFIDMGDAEEAVCSYCSTVFKFDPQLLEGEARPPEAVFQDDPA